MGSCLSSSKSACRVLLRRKLVSEIEEVLGRDREDEVCI